LNGDSVTFRGHGASVDGETITITSAGTYIISGVLDNGQIIVNTKDKKKVKLVLDGVDITCLESAPIYILNAEKTEIHLVDETENVISDTASRVPDTAASNEPNAAIFSKDDLTIKGDGRLVINANHSNGIQSKDDLKIKGGNITVSAANDGIKGKDSVSIKSGNIAVKAGADGIQSNNDEDPDNGYISIEGGTIDIISENDGIQAKNEIVISGGTITITSGGGSANGSKSRMGGWGGRPDPRMGYYNNSGADTISTKGIKAGVDLTIEGGTIHIDSADDSLHSDGSLTIDDGDITLASGDDGIRGTTTIEINGGNIDIPTCYEGIEATQITINDGDIRIYANDDGLNATYRSQMNVGIIVNGGNLDVAVASGDTDGFDSNGSLLINGGTINVEARSAFDIGGQAQLLGGDVTVNGVAMTEIRAHGMGRGMRRGRW
jgi:hypothetical protein